MNDCTSGNFVPWGSHYSISIDEPDAVKLSVYTKEKKQVSEMCICSVGADFLLDNVCESANVICPGMEEKIADCFTVLPILLCRGNIGPRKIFFEWLKTEFDCSICQMEFNSLSLAWMLTMWSTLVIDKKNPKPTKITWSCPLDDIDLNRIECVFDSESIAALYQGSRRSSSDVIVPEEVKKFLECIEEHLTQSFRIKFQGLPLQQLHMEVVHLHTDGKIKILSPEHVHSILSHLTCLSIEKMQWKSRPQ